MEAFVATYAYDLVIVAVLFSLIVLYNYMRGTGVSLIIAVAIPIAVFMYSVFPYYEKVTSIFVSITPVHGVAIAKSTLFAVFLALSLALPRSIARSGFGARTLGRVLAVSFITTVFILILIFQTLGLGEFGLFSGKLATLLGSEVFSFWFIVVSLGALFLI